MAALSSSGFEIAVRPGLFRSLIGLGLVAGTALFSGSGCREESRGVPPAASPVPEAPPPPPPEDPPDEPPDEPPAAPPPVIFTEKDQAEMVYVAAGEFLMGTSEADVELYAELFPLRPASAFDDERPQRPMHCGRFAGPILLVTIVSSTTTACCRPGERNSCESASCPHRLRSCRPRPTIRFARRPRR